MRTEVVVFLRQRVNAGEDAVFWLTCKNPWITPPCRTGQPFPGLALALSRSGPSRWPFRRILHFGHILKGMPSPLTSNPALLAVFAGFGVHHRTDLPDWSPSPRKVAVMIPDSCAKCTSFGPGPTLSLGPGPVTMDRRPFGGTSGGPGPAHIIGPGPGKSFSGGTCHARGRFYGGSRWRQKEKR